MQQSLWLASASLAAFCFTGVTYAQSSTETYTYDALGRLVKVVTTDGQNHADTRSYCYDDADNRTQVLANTSNGSTICGSAPPPPPPPPPPPNDPPDAEDDIATAACSANQFVNLTNNDDGSPPLTLVSIVKISGSGSATIANASTVSVIFPSTNFGTGDYTYTVEGPSGATDTASFTAMASCGGLGV
ncbi:MAG: RHS repeat domain-containing protein [Pseudomonadota bacterium]